MSNDDQPKRIKYSIQMLERDVRLTHDIVHGDESSIVQTEGGPIPSHKKVAADGYKYFVDELRPRVEDINQHAEFVKKIASDVSIAKKWAMEKEDIEIEQQGYSAYHWAQKAKKFLPESEVLTVNGKTGHIKLSHEDIGALPDSYQPKWDDIAQKPEEFTPTSHSHERYELSAGIITIFAGTELQIPDGWQLCNGQGQTSNGIQIPDLRGRMVTGSGGEFTHGLSGGNKISTTSIAEAHTHELTITDDGEHRHLATVGNHTLSSSEMPSHNHVGGVGFYKSDTFLYEYKTSGSSSYELASRSDSSPYHPYVSREGSDEPHNHSVFVEDSDKHNHSGSEAKEAGTHEHVVDIMPPFYVLAFIIKL